MCEYLLSVNGPHKKKYVIYIENVKRIKYVHQCQLNGFVV